MHSPVRSSCLAALVLLTAASAPAQTPQSQRPYRGLFASGNQEAADSLTVTASAGGGWDTSTAADVAPSTDNGNVAVSPLRGAGYGLFSGALVYSSSRQRSQFGASISTSGRYYPSFSDPYLASHAANVGLGYRVSRSTSVNLSETVSYQPFGSLNLFPELNVVAGDVVDTPYVTVAPPNLDARALRATYYTSSSNAGISHQLSRRSQVSAAYSYRFSHFGDRGGNFRSQTASGRFTRSVTQNLSLRLGYGYTESRFVGDDTRFRNHIIDTGVNYNRAFSVSRRTTVGFDTGATAVSDGTTTRWDVLGGVQLVHEIARTWAFSAAYRRDVRFVETLNQPLFSDAVNASLGGLVSRRVQVNMGAGASNGSLGFGSSRNGLWSYYGSAGLSVALSRHLAIASGYNYYHYKFDDPVYRTLGFSSELNRHSVSVFLNAWAPIFQKGQRPNASR